MKDIVLYDSNCRFCQKQIKIIKNLDIKKDLVFLSIHDPSVSQKFPQLTKEQLDKEMYIVSKNNTYSGAEAIKYLSRKIMFLWPLAILLHMPFSFPLWKNIYLFVAKNRYKIAGCENEACRII